MSLTACNTQKDSCKQGVQSLVPTHIPSFQVWFKCVKLELKLNSTGLLPSMNFFSFAPLMISIKCKYMFFSNIWGQFWEFVSVCTGRWELLSKGTSFASDSITPFYSELDFLYKTRSHSQIGAKTLEFKLMLDAELISKTKYSNILNIYTLSTTTKTKQIKPTNKTKCIHYLPWLKWF